MPACLSENVTYCFWVHQAPDERHSWILVALVDLATSGCLYLGEDVHQLLELVGWHVLQIIKDEEVGGAQTEVGLGQFW